MYRLVKVFGVSSCLLQKWPATFHSHYTEHTPFYLQEEGLLKPSIPCSAETQKSKEMGNQIGIQIVPTFHCCSPCSTWHLSCSAGVTALPCWLAFLLLCNLNVCMHIEVCMLNCSKCCQERYTKILHLCKLLSILLKSLCVYTHLLSRWTVSVIFYLELLKNITE